MCASHQSCLRRRGPPVMSFPSPPQALLLADLYVYVSLWSVAMAAPLPHKPRWVNPCSLPGHVFDAAHDHVPPSAISEREIFSNIIERALVAHNHATHAKNLFVQTLFNEPEFEYGMSDVRHHWLPEVPDVSKNPFYALPRDLAFIRAYMTLQSYGVGMEQAIIDQVVYSGQFVSLFRDVEDHLTQVLCELQLGMHVLRIRPEPDVQRQIMSRDYRQLASQSQRNWRDFLLLRDLAKANAFVAHLFQKLAQNTSSL